MPLDHADPTALQHEAVEDCEVLIVGGGPAGSTAAAILAEKGRRVVLLEKDRHPRFHIGESLLPQNLRIFDRLGIREEIDRIGVFKPGARFVSDEHGKHTLFEFAAGLNQDYTYSYQVRRSEFDEILFRKAASAGAALHEGVRVMEVKLDARDGHLVTARDESGTTRRWRARFLIDASGRDTLLATRLATKQRNPHNTTAAIYAHFRGVAPFEGQQDDGNITIHLFDEGWFWSIPLPDGVTSIGVVGTQDFFKRRKSGFEEFFAQAVAMSPSLSARLAGAERISPVTATGNYSYESKTMHGDGWIMVGDAYAFIDPVFSSGVLLAMASAEMGAEAAHVWLDDPRRADGMIRAFERKVRRALHSLSWLIYRINTPVLRDMFMEPRNRFRMREGLVSLLAGDVHANTNRQFPVLAFKAAFYVLQIAYRFGFRLREDGLTRAA